MIVENKYRYLLGVLCLVVVDGLQLILPWLIGEITNLLESGGLSNAKILQYALIVIAMAIGIASFRFFWRYLILGVSKKIEASIRERFYAHLQKLGAFYYNTHKTGDLMAHATNDIGNITMATGMGVIISIDSILIPIVAVVMMINSAGFQLTLASFAPFILLFVFMLFFTKTIQHRITDMQEAFSVMTETARENFSGIRVIKSFVQELKEIQKFEKANKHNKQMNVKFVMLMNMLFPTIMTISSIAFVIGLWFGGILVIRGQITLGGFIAFNSYLGMLVWPIAALGWVISIFQRGLVSLKRVNVIMDEVPEIQDKNTTIIPEIKGSIEIRNLSFAYPGTDKTVLKNINLTLCNGKMLAIVGRTGSGKSTLVNLIPKLYNVPDGTLFIDGTDINRIPVSTVRDAIGCVPQDTFLFSSTIRDNIDFFHGKNEDEIIKASKTAMIYDDVMEYPRRFETQVGERGVTLSGGQKQRVAIARAVLKSPAILILDDCLSAVDTRTEEEILKGMKLLMKQRTSIIVSHRISTIQDADEIIVLENGEVIERGTHESLLSLKGEYHDLYQKQLLAEQIEGEE
ncbi:MAG: ABC transporter ATP-binding protein [Clostridiales bacterium]|nr:ABC transporter ATP-binding protein [Clostridiales bacterium]